MVTDIISIRYLVILLPHLNIQDATYGTKLQCPSLTNGNCQTHNHPCCMSPPPPPPHPPMFYDHPDVCQMGDRPRFSGPASGHVQGKHQNFPSTILQANHPSASSSHQHIHLKAKSLSHLQLQKQSLKLIWDALDLLLFCTIKSPPR